MAEKPGNDDTKAAAREADEQAKNAADEGPAPDPIDDAEPNAPARASDDDGDEDAPAPKRVKFEDQGRGAVYEASKVKRKADKAADDDMPDYSMKLPDRLVTGGDEDDADDEDATPAPKTGPAPLQTSGDEIEVVVDGTLGRVKKNDPRWSAPGMTDAQIRNNAQIRLAAENRLQQANQLKDSERNRTQPRDDQPDEFSDGTQPKDTSARQTRAIDRDKLNDIAQRIQLGTPEEGVEALGQLIEETVALATQSNQGRDITAEVKDALVNERAEGDTRTAIERFVTTNADIAKDPYLSKTVLEMAADMMLEDMGRAGVPKDLLEPLRGKGRLLAQAHSTLRANGHQLDTPGKVLERATDKLRQTYRIARPNTVQVDKGSLDKRVEQKRQQQPQPRAAGGRSETPGAPRPKSRQDHIRDTQRTRAGGVFDRAH